MEYFRFIEPWIKTKLLKPYILKQQQRNLDENQQKYKIYLQNFIKQLEQNQFIFINSEKQQKNKTNRQIEFAKIEMLSKNINIQTKIHFKISLIQRQLYIHTTFLRNGRILTSNYYPYRLLLCRYFNKINSNEMGGMFIIDPENGQISYNIHILRISSNYQRILNKDYINSRIEQIMDQINSKILRILFFIDKSKNYENLEKHKKKKQQKKKQQEASKMLEELSILINFFKYQQDFMYDERLKKKKKFIKGDQLKQQEIEQKKLKIINFNLTSNTSQLCLKQKDKDIKNTIIQNNKEKYILYLKFPMPKFNQKDRSQIYNEIHIVANTEWEKINQGGFSFIQRAKVTFYYKYGQDGKQNKHSKQLQITKLLVKKSTKITSCGDNKSDKDKFDRIQHEKQILKIIANQSNINVAKFYFSQQFNYKYNLFLDYYPSKTLKNFIRSNQCTMSLLSRFYISSQIVQGIRFLADNQIIHFDIKPQNILIGKTNIVKISDYGQAYHKNVNPKELQRGFTVPYAPPESFQHTEIDSSIDVYSISIVLNELFFDNYPYKIRKMRYTDFEKCLQNKEYEKLSISLPQNAEIYGPFENLIVLKSLILKGISKVREERPKLDWMVIFLKQSIALLDKSLD